MSKHLTVLLRNVPGEFLRVVQKLEADSVKMLAFHLASTGPKSGYVQILCDDHNKALTTLATEFQLYVQESEVVLLRLRSTSSDIGPLLSDFAAKGINLENAYQTLDGSGHTLIILEAGNAEQLSRARLAAREYSGVELLTQM